MHSNMRGWSPASSGRSKSSVLQRTRGSAGTRPRATLSDDGVLAGVAVGITALTTVASGLLMSKSFSEAKDTIDRIDEQRQQLLAERAQRQEERARQIRTMWGDVRGAEGVSSGGVSSGNQRGQF